MPKEAQSEPSKQPSDPTPLDNHRRSGYTAEKAGRQTWI